MHRTGTGRLFFALLALLTPGLDAADWPTYRHDNSRSGVTPERLQPPLWPQWVFRSPHPPAPGWSDYNRNEARLEYDHVFHVVAAGDSLYFASSAENKLYALDAGSGAIRWPAYTDAPPRLAPTLWKDRLLAGADDGVVRCFNAADGRLAWRFRAAPEDQRVLGHGRIMSLWPVRTGVMVEGDTAYSWAGLFPSQGRHYYALRADDGQVVYHYSSAGERPVMGSLLALGNRIIVPTGRTPPFLINRENGRWAGGIRRPAFKGSWGGTSAFLADGRLYNIGGENIVGYDLTTPGPWFTWPGARRAVVDKGMAYIYCQGCSPNESAASGHFGNDEAQYAELLAIPTEKLPAAATEVLSFYTKHCRGRMTWAEVFEGANVVKPAPAAAQEKLRAYLDGLCTWRLPIKEADRVPDSLILAGDVLYAGGDGRVGAFDAATGKPLWTGSVNGRAKGLAVADGRLFVSTTAGDVWCFAPKETPRVVEVAPPTSAQPYPPDELSAFYEATADSIVNGSGVRKGYCLILGGGTGRLAFELARRTELRIYVLEPDAAKVAAARKALSTAGLYGARVCVEQSSLSSLPYPPYFANLIVCQEASFGGDTATPPAELWRVMRPLGGVAYVGRPPGAEAHGATPDAAHLQAWLKGIDDDAAVTVEGAWARIERGPVTGAGEWTHQFANPANTVSSEDRLAGAPFGILWFGDPGPERMVYRHRTAAAPLSVNGRLFIQGKGNMIMAYDAYNGVKLWERKVPGARRIGTFLEAGNMAATDDSLFIALERGGQCVRLNAANGETRQTYSVPSREDGQERRWGWTALDNGLLYGSRTLTALPHIRENMVKSRIPRDNKSECVFALDAASGEMRWIYNGRSIRNLGIAIGDGKVFVVDGEVTEEQRRRAMEESVLPREQQADPTADDEKIAPGPNVCLVTALDAVTGQQVWTRPIDVTDCIVNSWPQASAGMGGEFNLIYKDNILLLFGFPYASKGMAEGTVSGRRRTIALASDNGTVLWSRRTAHLTRLVVAGDTIYAEPWAYEFRTGKQKMLTDAATGEDAKWHVRTGGCGPITASASVLFFRKGCIGYFDLRRNQLGGFRSLRPGCGFNIIPAGGLVLIPESSEGCECVWSIKCSLALYPKERAAALGR